MPRFLHTADWQIGRLFSSFDPEDALPLAEARLAAVERLAALACTHEVDAVLVAGDVFDAQTVSERTIRRMFNAMAGFSGPWVLISGNHDAALAESVWTRAQRLGAVPAHVHLALRPEPLLLEACRTAILPAPLSQRHTYGDSTAWFDAAETPAGWLRLGLAHGSVQGILAESMVDATNPIAPDRAARARLDYLALGDWHGGKRIEARCWYSGTPEPDRFKANDSGQALLVEIDAPGVEPRVQALRTAQFDWLELSASLRVASDLDGLLQRLEVLPAHSVLSLRLEGQLALDLHQRLYAALAVLRGRLRHLSVEASALNLAPTDEDIAALQADGYLAEVIAELRELGATGPAQSSEEPGEAEIAREAVALLTATLAQRRTELSA